MAQIADPELEYLICRRARVDLVVLRRALRGVRVYQGDRDAIREALDRARNMGLDVPMLPEGDR